MKILFNDYRRLILSWTISRNIFKARGICTTYPTMDKITDISLTPISESKYIRPQRIFYNQDGKKKAWDAMKVHDSVAILIHNITTDTFVFVKQFRPAVYINKAKIEEQADGKSVVDHKAFPGSIGVTYELCAGITDKDAPLVQIAKEEVLEETGYDVPLERFEKITSQRSGVGVTGSLANLYYVTVTDDMKTSAGGGCQDEGEFIEVANVPVKDSLSFAMNDEITKPIAMMFALLWYHQFKAK